MSGLTNIEALERWQNRFLWWMTGLSVLVHVAALLLGSTLSSLFPPVSNVPVVTVELTEVPLSELPEEKPDPLPVAPKPETVPASDAASVRPSKAPRPPSAQEWLKRLDAGLPRVQEAPVARGKGRAGGLPVRRWETDAAPKPGDFAPAVAPENQALLRHIATLEGKIRDSGVPGIGTGEEIEASVMFGGVGESAGEQTPPWIRDMIRRKVRGYLPELEAAYSVAFRRNPALKGRLMVRFRIDPAGKVVQAEPAERAFGDDPFLGTILDKIRRWTFDPTQGRTVEVLYPFVFIAPS